MWSDLDSRDGVMERGSIPLDIDNVHMLLQVEQEQIQKRTFTNWVNAQLAKRRPPCRIVDLFSDFRDGSRLLDLLEVMSGQRFSRERGRGMFQHRSNVEKALSFLKKKSIKLVNINIPDIIDGKPSIILGLIWTIILQYHIEELASGLSFDSRQSSMESLASLDSRSTLSSRSTSSSPLPPRGTPLHTRFRVSAKKALLLWVREQCHKAGCSINVKDFKASWRSGVVFLAVLYGLRPDLVDLSKARTRSNRQNLEEAFRIAERELRIPRLLEPDDVDVRDPDEKSIMTYVAQFLQYSRDLPAPDEEMQTQYLTPKTPSPINLPVYYTPAIAASPLRQATPDRKAQEVTCWLVQAYDELLEGWDSTEGESYSERYHVFQTFLVSFNEQRRPIMPLLTAMRRTSKLGEEQRALREAWDALTEKLREYKMELDTSLPAPLDTVARWLLRTEDALTEEEGSPQDHGRAADEAKEKQELLKVCLEEMPQQFKTFQSFQNLDEFANMIVPIDKMDELKRRFTSVRVSAKYHGIKLEYQEHRHTVLDLLGQIRTKLRVWKRPYISPEAVRVLLHEWHDLVNTQEAPSLLETALHKLKQITEKYSSKSALAADYHHVSQQVKQLEEETAVVLEEVTKAKSTMGRVLSAWDSYTDCFSSLQAWLQQGSATPSHGHRAEVTSESMAEWGSRQAHLSEVGNFLIESTNPQTSKSLAEELRRLNMHWAEFVKRNTFDVAQSSADVHATSQDPHVLIKEASLILKEPLEVMAGPLRTYRKRIQFIMKKIKEVDVDALPASPEYSADQLQKIKLAIPEVMQTLCEAEQMCAELQHSVSGLDCRLAELLHWEMEARELYQLLRSSERHRQQRGQDPQARLLISRGLQLEGQVVTEEQDLQVMVMTSQKNSPIQFLHASAMQDKVRAAVAQSQATVCMISSLGSRRDRSRSPPEGPPSKIFIRTKDKTPLLTQPTQQLETKLGPPELHKTFVPKIVVQEVGQEKTTSPPMPYTYAQAVIGMRTKSPPETGYMDTTTHRLQHRQEQGLILQQKQINRQIEKQQQRQDAKHQQQVYHVEPLPSEPQEWQQKEDKEKVEQQQVEVHQSQVQPHLSQTDSDMKQNQDFQEQALPQRLVKKPPMSSEELQSKKARATKNRPWLQKPSSGEHNAPSSCPEQDSTQDLVWTTQTSVEIVQQGKEQQRQTQEPHLDQQHQEQIQHRQLERQQKQQTQQTIKKPLQPDSETHTVTAKHHQESKSEPHTTVQSTSQKVLHTQVQSTQVLHTDDQQSLTITSQTRVSQGQLQKQALPQTYSPVKSQSSNQPLTQVLLQPQGPSQPPTCVPSEPQPGMQSQLHLLGVAHGPAHAQVRLSSPMQGPLHGQIQPSTPSHIQFHSPQKAWAPVRPPSPKPPTQTPPPSYAPSVPQPPGHAPSMPQPPGHAPSVAPPPSHAPSVPQPPGHAPSMPQPPGHAPSMPQTPGHAPSVAPPPSHAPSMPQPPGHAPSMPEPPGHAPSMPQPPGHAPSMPQPPGHAPSMLQPMIPQPQTQHQRHIQPKTQQSTTDQIHTQDLTLVQPHPQPKAQTEIRVQATQAQTLTQHITHPQPAVLPPGCPQTPTPTFAQPPSDQSPGYMSQSQLQSWTQVRASSPMSAHLPKGVAQPQLFPQAYSQACSPSQQWTPKPDPPNQAIVQAYPQQMSQAPQSFLSGPAPPQWPQAGPQQGPQIGSPGYPVAGPPYVLPQMQPQTQSWPQTQLQISPPSVMQTQMRAYNVVHIQTQQDQVQQQTWNQAPPQLQPHPSPQTRPQQYPQVQPQIFHPSQPQMPLQPHPQHVQPEYQLKAESQTHFQIQSSIQAQFHTQPQLNLQFQQPVLPAKHEASEIHSQSQTKEELPPQQQSPVVQSSTEIKIQPPTQPKAKLPPQSKREHMPAQATVQSLSKSNVESIQQMQIQTATQHKTQSPAKPKIQSTTQHKFQTLSQSPPELHQAQSQLLPKAQTTQQSNAQSPLQDRPQTQLPLQSKPQRQSPPEPKPTPTQTLLPQVSVLPQSQAESPDFCGIPPPLAQVPPQAYTEAYAKAQALARNGFEEAKHCLQQHILEAISVFKDKRISPDQVSVKEETLRTLDPELLEEFLRAAKGMEAFCTPSQLRDMEFFTQSVKTQWEAVRAEIFGFLQQLQFEVTRKDFNKAGLQCEIHLSSQIDQPSQACFSEAGSFAQAEHHLEALKELCDTLSPEDAHLLAQTQLSECEKRLAAIQHQFSGDQEAPLPDSRVPVFSEDVMIQKETSKLSDKQQVSAEVPQVTVKTVSMEKREFQTQVSTEEEASKKEAAERYESCKKTLQTQLSKNEQAINDNPSDSVSLKGLHTRLQEIQFLRQETGSLWSEYTNQCSSFTGSSSVEQEKAELQEMWHSQQSTLQRRGSSLGTALRQIDSTENHMVDFTDRLDRYLRLPKDITAFTLTNTNILKDIKELDDNIQNELDQLSRLDSESSDLDPRDSFPLSREVETHKTSLDQLRQQVRKSEAAARALDRFLMSLRAVDEDISGVQGAPCSDAVKLQDCRSKLSLIKQSIESLKEKAPQLDLLLQGARLTVTRDCVPASCLDMVTALLSRLEEADGALAKKQEGIRKDTQNKSLGLRKRTLLGDLRKLQQTIEMQGLKEPTLPAVQHGLCALSDLEAQLQTLHAELQNLRELQKKEGGGEHLLEEVETQWKQMHRGFSERKKQFHIILELLKKFQSCRGNLSSTIQRAEQTIGEQASYMGKDNLQRSMSKVCDIKQGLSGLGSQIEDVRGICRQLQSELKKFPECSETSFEAEAETLMDNWLDVTEKTDSYMDNLRVGLELWEKQLMLGAEVDSWAGAKLALFAESHPFHNEQQVLNMRDDIHANEENIEHFHKKSAEIQEMLQSQEAPLELQVIETQLRKRIEQVKELFTDCTDVFEELVAVKKHLAEKIEECQSAVDNVQCSVTKLDASGPNIESQIQDLCDDLDEQEKQAEDVFKEVGLVSSVASPQVLEALSVDCSKLKDAISRTRDMIHLKREEREKGLLKVIEDERQSFEEWFQDLQLSVNECFENPECRTDVETSLQRLIGFLKSKDAERRLDQLKAELERGSQQIPSQQLPELTDWLKEQQEEVGMFRTHCHNRQKKIESLLVDLNSLQKQHDSFRDWLQTKEKQSVVSDKVKLLYKDLQDESGRADSLSEMLASVRRQGVRCDCLLKDSDNLIQRYRNLQARLQKQVEVQEALKGEYDRFNTEAENTRTWMTDLLQTLTSTDTQAEDMKSKAQIILTAQPTGDSKLINLISQSQSLCEQEDLEDSRKEKVQQLLRTMDEQWRLVLQTAGEALKKAETRALLDNDMDAFRTQNENFHSWIRDQENKLQSVAAHMQVEEKLQIAQATLSSQSRGESKLQDLKKQGQSLCENLDLEENRRQDVQDAIRDTEETWREVLRAAEEAVNKAETEAAKERDFNDFKSQSDSIRSWITEQRQKLSETFSSHTQYEERLQVAQAVLNSKPEGQTKLLNLKKQGEGLKESRNTEVQLLITVIEQQWNNVLQTAGQMEQQCLSDDFEAQSKNAQTWIRDIQQKLQSVGSHIPPVERCHTAQTILSSRPEGDFKVNNLRRRGQSLCEHQYSQEGRKANVQQTVKETEELWREVLQAAKQVEIAAELQISQDEERRRLELREFDDHQQDTDRWLLALQQQVDLLSSQTKADDRLQTAQSIMGTKPQGESKLQELKRRAQGLCSQDIEEHKKQEVQQKLRVAEEQWIRVLQEAKQALDKAERQCDVEGQLRNYESLKQQTGAWLEHKQQILVSLESQGDPEKTIHTAQTILSSKPEGDAKLTELRRKSQSLSDQEDLEEHTKQEAQQIIKDSEEQWKKVLQTAETTLKKAEIQYLLNRELEAFWAQAGSITAWVKELQQQADCKGKGTIGSQAQLKDRLESAQLILSSKANGDGQVTELKTRARSLCDQKDLEKDKKRAVEQAVKDAENQWKGVLQAADDTQRQLRSVVESQESYQYKRGQAEARLSALQEQTASLPRVFSWPGLGERRQAVEQARALLDQSTALAPILSDLRTQAAELHEITQDPCWCEPSWQTMEACIPALLKQQADAVANLEQGILTERQCTQLIEQHEAAQDWLREQVKGLGAPPMDRQTLHSTVNTLKALLQTVDREQREMKELDTARDRLMGLCTQGGQDAVTLEVSHLQDLCADSERDVREHLTVCETRLEELDSQLARRVHDLTERAAALQWELRSLDQALSYSEPQNNIPQLQQRWLSLENCKMLLQALGVKVCDLHQEVTSTLVAQELPAEMISSVESLSKQHHSLESRLIEHQAACSTNTARYLTHCLDSLQQWSQTPSEPVTSAQLHETLQEGGKLQLSLQDALSHQKFLKDCLTQDLFEKLETDVSVTFRDTNVKKASLKQSLKELDKRSKQKRPDTQSSDVLSKNPDETNTSVVVPPRKKRLPEKKFQKQDGLLLEEESLKAESVQIESTASVVTLKATAEDTSSSGVEQTRTIIRETVGKTEALKKPDSQIIEAVVEKAKVKATRRTSKEGPEDQQPCPTAHTITNETTVVQMGKFSAPERKTKGLKTSPELTTKVAAEITQEPVRQKSLEEPETKQTQIIRKSKSFDISAPQKTISISGTTTQDDSNQTEKDATSVVQAVIRTAVGTIVEELEQSPTTTVSTSSEVPHLGEEQSTEKPNSPVTDDAVVEPSRRTSKDIPYSQQPASSPDIIKGPTKTTDVELGKVSPPKRKTKGLKTSPELCTKVVTEITREPVRQKCLEETQMKQTLISRKSKGLDVSSSQEPLSPPVGTTDVASVEVEKDIGREKTTSIVQTVTETTKSVIVVEESISPSSGVSESSDICLSKKTEATEKPDSQISEAVVGKTKVIATRRTSEEGPECQQPCPTAHIITEPNETTAVEMGMSSPPKRKTKGLKPSPELATQVAAEITQEPVRQKSLEEPETKQTQIIRKSKSFDIFAPQKTIPISGTTTQDDSNQTEKDATSVVQAVIRAAVGTIVEELEQSATTTVSTSSEVPHLGEEQSTEKPDSPVTDDAVVESSRRTSKDIPDSQQPASSPDIIKGPTKTTDVEVGKVSPPKRKTKGLKPSPELTTKVAAEITQEPVRQKSLEEPETKQTLIIRKSKSFDIFAPQKTISISGTTTQDDSNQTEKDATSVVQAVIRTAVGTIVEEVEQSPTTTVSTSSEVPHLGEEQSTEKPDSPVTDDAVVEPSRRTSKDIPYSQQPASSPDIIKGPTRTTDVELGKVSPPKRKTKGLKTSPELTTKVAAEITQEPVRQKSLEEPETKQTQIIRKSKSFDISAPQKTISINGTTTQDDSNQTEKDATSVVQAVIRTAVGTIVEEVEQSPTTTVSTSSEVPHLGEEQSTEKPDSPVTDDAVVEPSRRTSKDIPYSQQPASSPDIIKGPTKTTDVELGKVSPPKRKTKGLKTSPELCTKVVTEITREPVRQKCLEETQMKQTLISRKSKGLDVSSSQEPLSPPVGTTDVASVEVEKDIGREKTTSIVQTVTETTKSVIVVEESLSPSSGVSESSDICLSKKTEATEKPDSQISEAVVGKTKVIATRRTSEEGPECQQPCPTAHIITEPNETTAVEMGMSSPPKRKTKGLKPSPELATQVAAEITQEPVRQKSLEEPETKQTQIIRKSKSFDIFAPQKTISISGTTTQDDSNQTEKDATSVVQAVIRAAVGTIVEELEQSPTTTVSTSSEVPHLGEEQSTEKPDSPVTDDAVVESSRRTSKDIPDSQQPASSPDIIKGPTKTTDVEVGKVSPPKRKTKGSEAFSRTYHQGCS
ncbi:nesprin-2-like isoform X2 [Betta splendens]|uniref:Nesprin-2-like isoform X2 n=1 Tax=Betta splendens TaxID=158456 RepID=A0A9W2XJ77_BETSP|nr:nesprin-2-like isoform X2 [Betta splendens]